MIAFLSEAVMVSLAMTDAVSMQVAQARSNLFLYAIIYDGLYNCRDLVKALLFVKGNYEELANFFNIR